MQECKKFIFLAIKSVVFLTLQVQGKVRERITARETGKIEQEKPDNTWNPSPAETDEFVEQLREVFVQILQREYLLVDNKWVISSSVSDN